VRKPEGGSIDGLIGARLQAEGLAQGRMADRRTLLRRATFDLTGLPPTPEEMRAFLADESPGAFAKVVDRLLASPHYGERWARHWLDVARYSDGAQGAREDSPYENAWRYRDWVVQALNEDLPYNEFVRAQIAADLLPGQKHLAALGFQTIGESDNDRVDVTTRAFLGFTVGCAQCHDHKFDPIPTKDYYSLLGVFKSSKVDEHPLVEAAEVTRYKDAKKAVAAKQEELNLFLEAQTKLVWTCWRRGRRTTCWRRGRARAGKSWTRRPWGGGRSIWPIRRRTIRTSRRGSGTRARRRRGRCRRRCAR
jgi:hypothetical protein